MARRFFSGATLEQAVLSAARYFETEPERISYSERERRHGVLNLRRKVAIEVDPSEPLLPDGEERPWQPKLAGVTAPVSEVARPGSSADKARSSEGVAPREHGKEHAGKTEERPADGFADGRGGDERGDQDGERTVTEGGDRRASGSPVGAASQRRGADSRGEAQDGRSAGASAVEESRVADRGAAEEDLGRQRAGGEGDHALMEDPLDAADDALGEIADFLLFDLQWEICQDEDESLSIDLSGEDGDRIVAEDGYVMRAVEHLLPRLIRSRHGQTIQVRVDCDGFRAKHEESMISFAEGIAAEVRDSGSSQLLDPMTPGDRRLVHVALADDPSVETASEGEGFTKRVRVSPS